MSAVPLVALKLPIQHACCQSALVTAVFVMVLLVWSISHGEGENIHNQIDCKS